MTREIIRTDNFSIRENKGKYYVYYIDRTKPKLRYLYVGSLEKVIEFYIKLGGVGATPTQCGGRDLNPRRPSPAEPQSAPFALTRAPPHTILYIN